ncbi:DEAD/DEAH box helicase [Aquisalimonas sp. 2447]|uniref:type ISP restriction/modification enzyme n=1 Tax=Aquisalimonas sp. 2447 TaxID=2740807 RepID=UPI0014326C5E|nr:type ISP restriction/modification enzyme [Aquisalimonas sp. 2447]QIT54112.1 DEAD/DEAH box helicase [Aquisalimonas sp. 2447]
MTDPTNAEEVFKDLAGQELSTHEKGDRLERFTKRYLAQVEPYANLFEAIWLWSEWPLRWGSDTGIDLVAREVGTGAYWAIQCKFYDPTTPISKGDIDAFVAASGRTFADEDGNQTGFDNRLVVTTTTRWSPQALKTLDNQKPPVQCLGPEQFDEARVDWQRVYWDDPETVPIEARKTLRPHQQDAYAAVLEGLKTADRGQLIMACGTGKTFTALRIAEAEALVPAGGQALVLVPSLALVGQTLREWAAQGERGFHAFVVCSDQHVSKDTDDITTRDLAYPATTDPETLAKRIASVTTADPEAPIVVFGTYHSAEVVGMAQSAHGLGDFDLMICDEAHRMAGVSQTRGGVSKESPFTKPLLDTYLRAKRRLFMTATPRIYGDKAYSKAGEAGAELYSMDDPTYFGSVLYQINFGEAVDLGLLVDYRVLIIAVRSSIGAVANSYNATYNLDGTKGISGEFVTRLIGSWKGLTKQDAYTLDQKGREIPLAEDTAPMRRAVAFANSIKASKEIRNSLETVVRHAYEDDDGQRLDWSVYCTAHHVDGGMHAGERHEALQWLRGEPDPGECRVLTNARCLSEGVDVPSLDGVIFFDTRDSVVEIAQSVGRVMRKAPGTDKQYGYIVLPVEIPSEQTADYNAFIERDERFKGVWKVLRSLRAHDERLVDEAEFRKKLRIADGTGKGRSGTDGEHGEDTADDGSCEQGVLDLPPIPVGEISEAVYSLVPKKLGDREYWASWARDVGDMAKRLVTRIDALAKGDEADAFAAFLRDLQGSVSPSVTHNEAVQMLAQHAITRPVFEALFGEAHFNASNPVAASLNGIEERFRAYDLASETEGLERFYSDVHARLDKARSAKARQDVIRNLYDSFFETAFPDLQDRLGIVYTPTDIVDFINRSADWAVREHFGTTLSDKGVHVIDPFTGTGTFLVRLIQQGLIGSEDLPRKMAGELHANEIVLLAYYIATVNVETAYAEITGEPATFEGAVLTDTFAMAEGNQADHIKEQAWLAGNSERAQRQRETDIQVVVGNPPYSAKQESGNESNANQPYPALDERIRETYAARSSGQLQQTLFDSYIRAIRWASDRIGDKGVVAFVTNGGFVDGNATDGLRLALTEEFAHLYVVNLRGNQRTSGELSRREGGKVFGSHSRAPVAITIMVKDPAHSGSCVIHYHDIGDYLTAEDKLARLADYGTIENLPFERIAPDAKGSWINQGDTRFDTFPAIGRKAREQHPALFGTYSSGVKTNRDAWVYNFSSQALEANITEMIEAYNEETERLQDAGGARSVDEAKQIIDTNPLRISWDRELVQRAIQGHESDFDSEAVRLGLYRPFTRAYLYFDKRVISQPLLFPYLFPTVVHTNRVIAVTGKGASKPFSTLVSNTVTDIQTLSNAQCFPRYSYEYVGAAGSRYGGLFEQAKTPDEHGYIRHDAITDWALEAYQRHYGDARITKDAIFWYVYGLLHSPDYRERFGNDLRRGLPRIPFVRDFWVFCDNGEKLADWHLNYEVVEPYPLEEIVTKGRERDPSVHDKMRFPGKRGSHDYSTVIVNSTLKLTGIPESAYSYQVNGKSPLGWVMERYQHTVDKKSEIENDPNSYSDDPEYIVNLVKRVVRVAVETNKLVQALPPMVIEDPTSLLEPRGRSAKGETR